MRLVLGGLVISVTPHLGYATDMIIIIVIFLARLGLSDPDYWVWVCLGQTVLSCLCIYDAKTLWLCWE